MFGEEEEEKQFGEKVSEKTARTLLDTHKRCVECGRTYALQIHHRVFKSEGQPILNSLLTTKSIRHNTNYSWGLNDIQNLVVLCVHCHEGNLVGIHGGNEKLRQKYRHSYTDPKTLFDIPFEKKKINYIL